MTKLPLPGMGSGELTGLHKRELVDWTKVTTFTSFWTNGANETHFGPKLHFSTYHRDQ